MANLTQQEFAQAIQLMADEAGLQRLRDRFVRLNAFVTRRRVASAEKLADQLYLLTGGLRRQVPATLAFHSLWTEKVNEKIGEDLEKKLEKIAERINACLGERDAIVPEKEDELAGALREYESHMVAQLGSERARLDMLLKTVPAVAVKLRTMPIADPAEPEPAASDDSAAQSDDAAKS
jgi:hypothetical protein